MKRSRAIAFVSILLPLASGLAAIRCSRSPESGSPPAQVAAPAAGPDVSSVSLDAPEVHYTSVIAEVNGRRIYRCLYDKSLNFIRDRLPAGGSAGAIELYINARVDALNRLVDDELIAQQAAKEGRMPGDEEVRAQYAEMVRRAGGEEKLLKLLRAEGMSKWEAIDGIRRKLAVDRFVKERVAPVQSVTDDEMLQYYNRNLHKFTPDLWVKLYQILILCPPDATPDRAEAARNRALKILANLRAGAPFDRLAREFSEDSESSRRGGSLGFVKQGVLQDVVDAVAFSIAPNQPSDVVRSSEGFHILLVTERHGGTVKPYEEVKELCRKGLMTMKQAGAIEDLTTRLREDAKIETYLNPRQEQ